MEPDTAKGVLCSVLQPEDGHKIHRNQGTKTACGISTAGMLSGYWPHQFGKTPDPNLLCRRGGCRG